MIFFLLIIYLLLLIATVYAVGVFTSNLGEGGLFHWWDDHVLFHLRSRNSWLQKPLGGCDQCMSLWLGAINGAGYFIALLYFHHARWGWYLLTPSVIFLTLGLTACIFQFKNSKNKT